MKRIRLSRGLFALVDDADYKRLIEYKWSAKPCPSGEIYAITNIKTNGTWRQESMHHMILPPPPGKEILFANFNGLDCRRRNLKIVDHAEACQHHRVRRDSRTGIKGVAFNDEDSTWSPIIIVAGRPKVLGYFDDIEEAKRAYDAAVKANYGPCAPLHNPEGRHPSARRPPERWIPPPDRKRRNTNPDALTPLLAAMGNVTSG